MSYWEIYYRAATFGLGVGMITWCPMKRKWRVLLGVLTVFNFTFDMLRGWL